MIPIINPASVLSRARKSAPGILLSTLLFWTGNPSAILAVESPTPEQSAAERMDRLEKAVLELRDQNQALQDELQKLKKAQDLTAKPDEETHAKESGSVAPVPTPAPGDIRFFWKDGVRFESADGKTFKGKVGGRIDLDAAITVQDSGSEALFGDIPAAGEFRRARIFTEGEIGLYTPTFYKLEVDFAGNSVSLKDAYIGAEIGQIARVAVGHVKEPIGLDMISSSRYITFQERAAPSEAFAPDRNLGVLLSNTWMEERATWALGTYADVDANMEANLDRNYRVSGRLTGLPWYDAESGGSRYLHLGLSGSYIRPENDSVRFRARPESSLVPRFADTGSIGADQAGQVGVEAALVRGPLSVQAEYFNTWVDSTVAGDPSFDGFYAQVSWFLTGEHRPYKRAEGIFDRVHPLRNFSIADGGPGAWEVGVRISHLDLNDTGIFGGKLDDLSVVLTWYLRPNTKVMLNYTYSQLDRAGIEADAHILQTRFHVDF